MRISRLILWLFIFNALTLAGCGRRRPDAPPRASGQAGAAAALDPEREPSRIAYAQLTEKLGKPPEIDRPLRIGAILKYFGNPFWQAVADGMHGQAAKMDVEIEIRAATSENDPKGQLALLRRMLERPRDVLLVSPQTDDNLSPLLNFARKNALLLNVNDAVLRDAAHWIGPSQRDCGRLTALDAAKRLPAGAKVAVITGLSGAYASNQRLAGFAETARDKGLEVVAQVAGNWELRKALDETTALLAQHPGLSAIYCENDIMALGAAEAVKQAGMRGRVLVYGTDGIAEAVEAVRSGDLAGTVDLCPEMIGRAAVETAARLWGGQAVPRAVFSPQKMVTAESFAAAPGTRGSAAP